MTQAAAKTPEADTPPEVASARRDMLRRQSVTLLIDALDTTHKAAALADLLHSAGAGLKEEGIATGAQVLCETLASAIAKLDEVQAALIEGGAA